MTPIVICWLLSGVSVNQSTRASSILEIQEELITLAVSTITIYKNQPISNQINALKQTTRRVSSSCPVYTLKTTLGIFNSGTIDK